MSTPKMAAIRAVFTAMFDAVDVAGDFTEDRWVDLIAAFNATGRLVFGWPHLESSESDIFGALDSIAMDLDATKNAIEQTTKDARIVLFELDRAVGGVADEPEEPPPNIHAQTPPSEPAVEHEPAEEQDAGLLDRVRALSPVDRLEEARPPYARDPQVPNAQDEALFAVIRADPTTTLMAAERAVGLAPSRAGQRMKLLDGYGTLPADIKEWRAGLPRGGRRPKPVYHPLTVEPEPELDTPETFEERRGGASGRRPMTDPRTNWGDSGPVGAGSMLPAAVRRLALLLAKLA